MAAAADTLVYHRLRAPSEAGQTLLEPPLAQLPLMLAANRAKLDAMHPPWIAALAEEARPALLFAAAQYTGQYRNVSHILGATGGLPTSDSIQGSATGRQATSGTPRSLILSGHQPQLFHAGVWFKNFVLSAVAKNHGAIGINLIVDNDTISSAAIRVPAGDTTEPRTEFVAFDGSSDIIPFEERIILDPACFDSFDQRVREATQAWLPCRMLDDLWPLAKTAAKRTNHLGYAICEARHRLEGEWGLETLEVPASTVFSQTSFHRILLHLLFDLPRFRDVYNACLLAYRQVNHIRSRAHPVPDLAENEGWLEAPLWIWSREQPRRQRLWVRAYERGIELTDAAQLRLRIPLRNADDSNALEQLAALEKRGIKLRPRALLTTMYARLVLSDLFIHGIGGAKYDELTDAIIHRYFEIEPPAYLTATATFSLPLEFARVDRAELLAMQQRLRALEFHAEQFIAPQELTKRKQALLRDQPPRGARKRWHAEFIALQQQLSEHTEAARREVEQQLRQLREGYRVSRLLSSREFAFCLFPADFVRPLLLDRCQIKS